MVVNGWVPNDANRGGPLGFLGAQKVFVSGVLDLFNDIVDALSDLVSWMP